MSFMVKWNNQEQRLRQEVIALHTQLQSERQAREAVLQVCLTANLLDKDFHPVTHVTLEDSFLAWLARCMSSGHKG